MSQDLALKEDATLEETLAHFGVLGMKWGKRHNSSSGGSSKSPKEKISDSQIMEARYKHQARVDKIVDADKDFRIATTEKGRKAAMAQVEKHATAIANDPDTRIAMKYTKGEKIGNVLVLGPIGALINHSNTKGTKKVNWDKNVAASNAALKAHKDSQ